MKKLIKAVAVFLIASGLVLGYASIGTLFEEGLNDSISLLPIGIVFLVLGIIILKAGNKKNNNKSASGLTKKDKKTKTRSKEIDPLMTGQLIALYKKEHEQKYMDEYIRRLVHIGFNENEALNLFTNESMNMKHDSIALLQSPTYLNDFYFSLKEKLLPLDKDYYVKHRSFTVTEITKIWDEAEWHYYYSHEKEMPDSVWAEIFIISRHGGAKLLVESLEAIAESSHIDFDKILNYSAREQDMLFKYKWNKSANEKHPYH